ncbi:MAG TPA: hypothetical protein VGB87_22960 [Vicinamibacteria bacterium]
MTSSRWNADLVLMALAIGAVALAYAAGAFVMAVALHPPGQLGWSLAEKIAVGLYPLGWVGLAWAAAEVQARWPRRGRA